MPTSPRCGARTRCGGSCRAPAVHGKTRCRMHGGAEGSGAPRANRNARSTVCSLGMRSKSDGRFGMCWGKCRGCWRG
ncbi:HGGxSTG domain-containing protein [Bradyrhizobium sp. UFLA01-814]|uniref:HGGxSTG domain-containing protein n=1 Tax=Bradyrhizobium sp. UFLA01-814 TaxID=3023480 RepID=UPI00398B9841